MDGGRWLLTLAVLGAGLGAGGSIGILRWRDRARRRRRWRRARRGDARADALLAASGFRVLDQEHDTGYPIDVDGRRHFVQLRVDRLLRRGRQLRLAEVKTGAAGTDPLSEATRRQLLEYAHAFGADEILLVDMERRRIRTVRIPPRGRRSKTAIGTALLVGALVGTGLGQVDLVRRAYAELSRAVARLAAAP